MEYVTPPRGALRVLHFFAGEPAFSHVVGDLSEELQQQARGLGENAARRWYWREAWRNAWIFARRELLRSPFRVLAVTLLAGAVVAWVSALGVQLMINISWAWIPTRFWPKYQPVAPFLFPWFLYFGAGIGASLLLKARELALSVTFALAATLSASYTLYFISHLTAANPPGGFLLMRLHVFQGWVLSNLAYSAGCFWMRRRRLASSTPDLRARS